MTDTLSIGLTKLLRKAHLPSTWIEGRCYHPERRFSTRSNVFETGNPTLSTYSPLYLHVEMSFDTWLSQKNLKTPKPGMICACPRPSRAHSERAMRVGAIINERYSAVHGAG